MEQDAGESSTLRSGTRRRTRSNASLETGGMLEDGGSTRRIRRRVKGKRRESHSPQFESGQKQASDDVERKEGSFAASAQDPATAYTDASTNTAQSTNLGPTASEEERHSQLHGRVRQAFGLGSRPNPLEALSNDDARPSMLSALLSDILGLRGSRGGTPNADGVGLPHSNSRSGSGGTSVIVQGALVARTVARQGRPEQNDRENAEPLSQSTRPDSTGDLPQETLSGHQDNDGGAETHVATIDEQARMLVRLLSIATAATAASLVSSSPQGARPHARGGGDAPSSQNPLLNPAAAHHPAQQPTQESSTTTPSATRSSAVRDQNANWLGVAPTLRNLRSSLASIRSRLPSLDGRLRSNSAASSQPLQESLNQPPREERRPPGRAEPLHNEDDPATLSSTLSSMLRDAIRDGIHGTRGQNGEVPSPPHQEGSPDPRQSEAAFGEAHSRSQSVNTTLEAVRDGQLTRGEEGSFNRFLFDLTADLNVAVRGLPTETAVDDSSTSPSHTGETVDERTQTRRQRDTQDGHLSFFRFFRFPSIGESSNTRPSSVAAGDAGLVPCVVVGVRSLGASESAPLESLGNPRAAAPGARPGTQSNEGRQNSNPEDDSSQTNLSDESNESPMSRFLLFVSGGHYSPEHPIFHASDDEASRDLMVLMEFMGAMAAMNVKPVTTVTKEQIANSNLRTVNGTRTEIETLVKLQQVMENTSERCLICLEEWKDDGDERRLLDCGHLFHAPCLDQWLTGSNNSCPLCRRQAVTVNGAPAPAPMPPGAGAAEDTQAY